MIKRVCSTLTGHISAGLSNIMRNHFSLHSQLASQYKHIDSFSPNLFQYRGSPTSTVSSSTNSTITNFGAIGIKFVQVELLCSKIRTSGNWQCSTHQYEFYIVPFFPGPKNRTKPEPPVYTVGTVNVVVFFSFHSQLASQYKHIDSFSPNIFQYIQCTLLQTISRQGDKIG